MVKKLGRIIMNINTIILIDKNQQRKENFIKKLKQKIKISYTKVEALFQTIKETFNNEGYEFKIEQYMEFLDNFLNNLSKRQEMYLIDVDELLVQNANILTEKHKNIMIIYLQKEQNDGKIIKIDGNNDEEVNELIKEIEKRLKF